MVRSALPTCRIATVASALGGQQLNYGGRNERNRAFGYIGTRKKCGSCQQRSQCTTGPFRYLAIHMNEASATSARSPDDTGVQICTTTAEEGRSTIRRTQESHRSSSPAPAEVEVRPRAVLPGGYRPKHQTPAVRAVPTKSNAGFQPQAPESGTDFFNTHAC